MSRSDLPVVGISACKYTIDGPHHVVFDPYVEALERWVGGVPVLLPALGERVHSADVLCDAFLSAVDGILLTGSCSNVHPRHYGAEPRGPQVSSHSEVGFFDEDRDFTTLNLVRRAVAEGVPVLGICRGFQEINVALGGTLLQEMGGETGEAHRAPQGVARQSDKYLGRHSVRLSKEGLLSRALVERGADCAAAAVNSLHRQAIGKLAPMLRPEATSDDGVVEAASLVGGAAFCLGVQFHPEWFVEETPIYRAVFSSFGRACRNRAASGIRRAS